MSFTEKTTGLSKMAVWMIALSLALAGGAALMLFVFDPNRTPVYPVCHFHRLTGWHCPGCGSLRALHHLTHGELPAAFRCNPLLVVALPVLAWLAARALLWKRNRPASPPNIFKSAAPWVALGVLVLFGILRNLPHPAFAWMSP